MKKIGIAVLFICCFFAVLLELTGTDPEHTWSIRGYVHYVTENIEPLPRIDIPDKEVSSFEEFTDMIGNFFSFIWNFIRVVLHNIFILFDGLLPFRLISNNSGIVDSHPWWDWRYWGA